VIHPEQEVGEIVPNVVVTKEEPEVHEIRNVVIQAPVLKSSMQTPQPTPVLAAHTAPSDAAILSDLHRDDEEDDEADDASAIEPVGTPTATSEEEAEAEAEAEPDVESDSESEEEPDSESESESESEDEEEEEEEEDEDLVLKVIKKQRYYWSPSSHRIYECLEEGYGDCLGTYDGSKITPKA
jgi:hypothetical protein